MEKVNNIYDINTYDYPLDEELIAQTPIKNRSSSRLLRMNRFSGEVTHHHFKDITSFLHKDDVLVLNDTKVIPARLFGIKESTKANIEILLLKDLGENIWDTIIRNSRRLKINDIIIFKDGILKAKVLEKAKDGLIKLKLIYDGILNEILDNLGEMPLPPYIHEHLKDQSRYQTIYAKNSGSAAAPTAGLHFTKELLEEIEKKGIKIVYVTLHVGLGTFRPVSEENILNHHMHSEYYVMNKEVADTLNKAKKFGNKIIAVGTTSTRVLETVYTKFNTFKECFGNTDIFIYPGYEFKAIDSLITNFHLPKSTLMMLVSAFSSKDFILNAYNLAIQDKYRFFSFGDAMFIDYSKKKSKHYQDIIKKVNNKKSFLRDKKNGFKILKGNIPIMVSVPHAHTHIRRGKLKAKEYNTGSIGKILYKYTDCHLIYIYKDIKYDPNYDNENNYRKALKDYIIENNIKLLIDIHGMKKDYKYNIEIGSNNAKNVRKEIEFLKKIEAIFIKNKIFKVIFDNKFKAKTNTLSNYINKECNIKTIQVEIVSKYRRLKSKQRKFYNLINSLNEIITLEMGNQNGRRN